MNLNTERKVGIPRPFYTYRGWRRSNSKLGVEDRDWFGVSTKPSSKVYPTLVLQTAGEKAKHPGETHYVEAPW